MWTVAYRDLHDGLQTTSALYTTDMAHAFAMQRLLHVILLVVCVLASIGFVVLMLQVRCSTAPPSPPVASASGVTHACREDAALHAPCRQVMASGHKASSAAGLHEQGHCVAISAVTPLLTLCSPTWPTSARSRAAWLS
jgi:hypothetical protein